MKRETLKAVKALARKELPLPPKKIHKNKTKYNRHPKHKTGYQNDSGLFLFKNNDPQFLKPMATPGK